MLSTQLIGAAQNAAAHTPQENAASNSQPLNSASDADTLIFNPIEATEDTDRPRLELPKRAELAVAVPDAIPDAEPESIYKAKSDG